MSDSFTYNALPGRVVFGIGASRRLREEVERLGKRRVLVVASQQEKEIADRIVGPLAELVAGWFDEVIQHVPAANAAAVVDASKSCAADLTLTIGGGSATGFGKIVSLERQVPHIAIPTTYAGSEMTPIWGKTTDGRKETGRDLRVLPDVVVYDPELTLTLPPEIAGPSGMNALAHAVEATYAPGTNPVIEVMALEAVRRLHRALPVVTADPANIDGRSEALLGAYLAGCTLGVAGTALHHKACHTLGGMFDLGHGEMNSVMLPHALHYNAPAIPKTAAALARALGASDAALAIFELALRIGSPTSLAAIGMPRDGIEAAAQDIVERAAKNVRKPDLNSITEMLRAAFDGRRPGG